LTLELALFDIDGTLLRDPASGPVWDALAPIASGREGTSFYHIRGAGRTDRAIVAMLAALGERDLSEEEAQAILAAREANTAAHLATHPDHVRIELLPGALELLNALEARGARLGIASGNTLAIARGKLARAGLDLRRFCAWGSGERYLERVDLVRFALAQAGVDATSALVVGDTLHDVSAALAAGASVLAVSTGRFSAEELSGAGATYVADALLLSDPGVSAALARFGGAGHPLSGSELDHEQSASKLGGIRPRKDPS
jgi:phosphoglycolate phosphatase-like HAD superfamily hydrolase